MKIFGCPECGCTAAEHTYTNITKVRFITVMYYNKWRREGEYPPKSSSVYKCDDCSHLFSAPEKREACQCGGERFTTKPVGDETFTACDDCGREKVDENL